MTRDSAAEAVGSSDLDSDMFCIAQKDNINLRLEQIPLIKGYQYFL